MKEKNWGLWVSFPSVVPYAQNRGLSLVLKMLIWNNRISLQRDGLAASTKGQLCTWSFWQFYHSWQKKKKKKRAVDSNTYLTLTLLYFSSYLIWTKKKTHSNTLERCYVTDCDPAVFFCFWENLVLCEHLHVHVGMCGCAPLFLCLQHWRVCLQNKWFSGVCKHGQLYLSAVNPPIWYHQSTLSESPKCVYVCLCVLVCVT